MGKKGQGEASSSESANLLLQIKNLRRWVKDGGEAHLFV